MHSISSYRERHFQNHEKIVNNGKEKYAIGISAEKEPIKKPRQILLCRGPYENQDKNYLMIESFFTTVP